MEKLKNYKPTKFMAPDSYYDEDAANFAVNFIQCLCHTKGRWAGKRFELMPWQERIIRDLFGILKPNGYRQFNTAYIEISKKNGKSELAAAVALLLMPWQERIIRDLFGILKPNGYRQFNTAYIEISKKNGKSELAAAVALLLLAGDGEQRAEVYSAASDRQQASIVFNVAADMVRMCPSLAKRCKILASTKRIVYTPTNSIYQVLSSEAYTKHGLNISGAVIDEVHALPDRKLFDVLTRGSGDARTQPLYFLITTAGTDIHSICYEAVIDEVHALPDRKLFDVLTRGSGDARTQPLYFLITTAGTDIHSICYEQHIDEVHALPDRKLFDVLTRGSGDARTQPLYFLITTAGTDIHSICYEQHQKAVDLLEGRKTDPTYYPVIYGAEMDEDWTDPKVWAKANPSIGETLTIDKIEAACESAKQNPAEENSFRQLRLNQWVRQEVRWLPMDKWDACAFPINEKELEGRVCYAGLDLSSTTDLTAFVLVFPPQYEEDKYQILPYFWIPEDTVDLRTKRDGVPYELWKQQGLIQTTEGNVVHYGFIEKFIEELGERFNIKEIAFDRWNAIEMVQNLEGAGFTVVPFGQGFKDMSPPTKELYKLVLEKKIAHGGNPVLRWNMDNVYVKTDPAGNIKADKQKSTEKIDGAIACIMGLDRAIRCGNQNTESIYDSRGLLVF